MAMTGLLHHHALKYMMSLATVLATAVAANSDMA